MRAAGLVSSLRLLLVDIAFSVRLNEEATRVSQHFGVSIGFSSCACVERSADSLRNQSQELYRYDDVGVTYSLLLVVDCVVMVAADQQARKYKSVEKQRHLN
ncbi:hypothetical protein F511_29790 [Dorcoceras hygrometricum]|uniref:Secreted protein n=1 Tax=Dorcoceras hygrometricum TaxID=472368 RepID=A0A2Z7C768_9LAMI|nr:hypothetical protein F511_29790 [Dorcoceras hygrometricum]